VRPQNKWTEVNEALKVMISNLLTIRRMASLLGVAEEDVSLALMTPPVVQPTSRADDTRVFDREAFEIVRYRLEALALNSRDEESAQ
jgi:hypothetical protein